MTDCFAKDIKGCKALNYDSKDLERGVCNGCKFYKTSEQLQVELYKKSTPKQFLLAMDGINQGVFSSLIDIDRELRKYYAQHQEEENAKAKKDSCFIDDFNLMFENHKIQIIKI